MLTPGWNYFSFGEQNHIAHLNIVLEVQQIHERVVIQRERLEDVRSELIDSGNPLDVNVREFLHDILNGWFQALLREKRRLRLGVSTRLLNVVYSGGMNITME